MLIVEEVKIHVWGQKIYRNCAFTPFCCEPKTLKKQGLLKIMFKAGDVVQC
jgi:hypothetical protein